MSYYASEDDEIYQPKAPGRKKKVRGSSSSKEKVNADIIEASRTAASVESPPASPGSPASPSSEKKRRNLRLMAKKQERRSKSREKKLREKFGATTSGDETEGRRSIFSKKKKGRSKTRQERLYDDLYGTEYHEVDDGIVGCADALCVNKDDFLPDDHKKDDTKKDDTKKDAGESASKNIDDLKSPNTGEANKNVDENEEVYVVRQRYGYFSIFFGIIQIIVLVLMMWQCGIAPMNINPMFGPYPDALSEWGGKNSILIVEDDEWWRLITPILLHAGVIHLFCNVAVQLELGVFFEREWGSMTWLIIYLVSALGSSVLSVITMPDAVSVGSSGAVMGLFGAKLSEIICRCCEKSDTAQERVAHQVRKEQCIGVSCSVVVVLAFSFIPYVDWAAHLGGLLAGFFVGFMPFSFHLESYCLRLLWFLVGMGLTLGFFVPCISIMYSGDIAMNEDLRDVCGYYTETFQDYECNCMRDEYLENLRNNNFFNYNYGDDNYGDDNANGADDGGEGRFLYESLASYQGGY